MPDPINAIKLAKAIREKPEIKLWLVWTEHINTGREIRSVLKHYLREYLTRSSADTLVFNYGVTVRFISSDATDKLNGIKYNLTKLLLAGRITTSRGSQEYYKTFDLARLKGIETGEV